MNKKWVKGLCLVLCGALLTGGAGAAVYAAGGSGEESGDTEVSASVTTTEGRTEDETIYVFAGADGTTQKMIVSSWEKEEDGTDSYEKKTLETEPPVRLKITYTLDGAPIRAEELKGRSGRVGIRFDYENQEYTTATINGKEERLCVPFVMLTAVILDNEVFSNVEVTNAKLVNDGSRKAVVGIALPGLQESLGLDSSLAELPSYIEIQADVVNFELDNTVTVATNPLRKEIDASGLNTVEDLKASVQKMAEAIQELTEGAAQLYDGIDTLQSQSQELVGGVYRLSSGLNELTANNSQLNEGAAKVFRSLLSMANEELAKAGVSVPTLTIENYAEVLNGVIAGLDADKVAELVKAEARSTVTANVEKNRPVIREQVEAQAGALIRQKVTQATQLTVRDKVLESLGLPAAAYDQLPQEQKAAVDRAVSRQMESAEVQARMKQEYQKTLDEQTEKKVQELIETNMQSAEVQAKITEALKKAESGAAAVSALKQQLDEYREFYIGLQAYTAGVSEAADGASAMQERMPELVSGIALLKEGARQLSEGLQQFDEEAVSKLTEAVEGDLDGLLQRVRAMAEASEAYQPYGSPVETPVKFIYRTDAILNE